MTASAARLYLLFALPRASDAALRADSVHTCQQVGAWFGDPRCGAAP